MSILEARLVKSIKKSKSEISLLQMKLNELEGVIRHQDDVICKLSEDNLISLKLDLKRQFNFLKLDLKSLNYLLNKLNESTSVIHVNEQLINFRNTNNPSSIEISSNEDLSLLNNMQVPDPRENHHVKIDLTAKPKEVLNSQPNNMNKKPEENRLPIS